MLITVKQDKKAIDVKVDEKQKIIDVFDVLDQKRLISVSDFYKVRSIRKGQIIIALKSFKENEIYNGDILEIENQWN